MITTGNSAMTDGHSGVWGTQSGVSAGQGRQPAPALPKIAGNDRARGIAARASEKPVAERRKSREAAGDERLRQTHDASMQRVLAQADLRSGRRDDFDYAAGVFASHYLERDGAFPAVDEGSTGNPGQGDMGRAGDAWDAGDSGKGGDAAGVVDTGDVGATGEVGDFEDVGGPDDAGDTGGMGIASSSPSDTHSDVHTAHVARPGPPLAAMLGADIIGMLAVIHRDGRRAVSMALRHARLPRTSVTIEQLAGRLRVTFESGDATAIDLLGREIPRLAADLAMRRKCDCSVLVNTAPPRPETRHRSDADGSKTWFETGEAAARPLPA